MSMHTTTLNSYQSKYVWVEWLESFIKILSLVVLLHSQINETEQHAKQTHNHLMSILVFLRESLFCASCICWVMESRIATKSYVLLSMMIIWWVLQTLDLSRGSFTKHISKIGRPATRVNTQWFTEYYFWCLYANHKYAS